VLVRCFRTIPVPVRCFSPLRVGSVARFGVGDRFGVLEGVSGVFFVVLWRRIWRRNGCVPADFDGVVVVGGGAEEVMWWWVLRC
jgi:hypothetical protein